jgi:hypothetical protein
VRILCDIELRISVTALPAGAAEAVPLATMAAVSAAPTEAPAPPSPRFAGVSAGPTPGPASAPVSPTPATKPAKKARQTSYSPVALTDDKVLNVLTTTEPTDSRVIGDRLNIKRADRLGRAKLGGVLRRLFAHGVITRSGVRGWYSYALSRAGHTAQQRQDQASNLAGANL